MITGTVMPDWSKRYSSRNACQKDWPNQNMQLGFHRPKHPGGDYCFIESFGTKGEVMMHVWNGRNPIAEAGELIVELSTCEQHHETP